MAKFIVDIPPEKIASFMQALLPLGIDNHSMQVQRESNRLLLSKPSLSHLKKIASSFILFDWEFFSNELEYE